MFPDRLLRRTINAKFKAAEVFGLGCQRRR